MYNTIVDAYEDIKSKGYVIVSEFQDRQQMESFFRFYEKLEERLEASKKALEEYRKKP